MPAMIAKQQHLQKHIPVGAAAGCDLLIMHPADFSDISFATHIRGLL